MNGQTAIRILGFSLQLISIIFMIYNLYYHAGDRTLVIYGLVLLVIGWALASYGGRAKKEAK